MINRARFRKDFAVINTVVYNNEVLWHIGTTRNFILCARPTPNTLEKVTIPIEDESKVVFSQLPLETNHYTCWFSILLNYYRSGLTRKGYYNNRLRWYLEKNSGTVETIGLCKDWYNFDNYTSWKLNYMAFFDKLYFSNIFYTFK